ncbi:hypothetical protein MICAC_5930021 [Microcystis aeruginosa PCC 9443]|uniref:Transposase n=1 Tax=Microcystis aeruginosa PCC 9443 TaxID=1160281 RepID=I4G9X4_MICAE|nr:hypothetical protein MICAC_5930021 [Microcystis aeruginosa PCC 9443]
MLLFSRSSPINRLDFKTKKRFADKLYKVWLLSGEEVWILIHIEIQSQWEENFPQRMYIYNYRAEKTGFSKKPVFWTCVTASAKTKKRFADKLYRIHLVS